MHAPLDSSTPLAERIRPRSLEEFAGQEHLVGPGRLLHQLIQTRRLPSLLLWGPPGSGKTTLATILAQAVDAHFVFFSAVLSGVKEIRQIVEEARRKREQNIDTVLFVDEIHRFNKSQQDAFLPHVESGLLTLIGATTENPSFNVIAPLLSRCQTLVLEPLAPEHIRSILLRALRDPDRGLGAYNFSIDDEGLDALVRHADGDSRRGLNCLETAAVLAAEASRTSNNDQPRITAELVAEAAQHRPLRYDAGGEEHYNQISALHKSLRDSDPDGAVYWLARMLEAGEDPLHIARRLIRFASEDIGNADTNALHVSLNCRAAYHLLGSPEGELALLQAAVYLATAPKSNALYAADNKVRRDIAGTGALPVPLHLRNAPTKLMKDIGYGRNYQYAHDNRDALVDQEHLPPELKGRTYYEPTNRGYEATIRDRLMKWRKILQQRANEYERKKS
ncbi:MAG TPA: replication-associated recombination protein A [Desulfobacteraceae bacterium]|nr:replication-associated recombination protein A [Desulfobacteraceae bacterium]